MIVNTIFSTWRQPLLRYSAFCLSTRPPNPPQSKRPPPKHKPKEEYHNPYYQQPQSPKQAPKQPFEQPQQQASGTYQAKKEVKKGKPEYLYGINPVLASLSAQRRDFQKLYLSITEKGEGRKSSAKVEQIYKMATSYGVKTKYLHKVKLQKFTAARPHQNVVLKCSKLDYQKVRKITDIDDLANEEPTKPTEPAKGKFFLFLDQITDPQNFGSILRSAMFIGVDGVIVNQRNACGLTPTVSKVSSGALEFIPLYSVRFVSRFLDDAQRGTHKFRVISTDIQSSNEEGGGQAKDQSGRLEQEVDIIPSSDDEAVEDSKFLKDIKQERQAPIPEQQSESEGEEDDSESKPFKAPQVIAIDELTLKRDDNIILVLGSEGEGVSRQINKLADHRVMIPPQLSREMIGKYPFNMVDSLNVGVSAGLLVYHIRHLTKRS
ncbi:hypothetical protein FGO68_gene3015 [Halteria grandinella]|uniref:rRNA methyltransferase 1, mitochondrial n=1 Tax=Halteria grandinella TaxID=5974 RepID=A0A8J8NF08_HALGN|nr:hypothetical protein FGO68_gene3015 [Halteria grandinella]